MNKPSRQVTDQSALGSLDIDSFKGSLLASELNDIVENTPAIEWSDLQHTAFEKVAKRRKIIRLLSNYPRSLRR